MVKNFGKMRSYEKPTWASKRTTHRIKETEVTESLAHLSFLARGVLSSYSLLSSLSSCSFREEGNVKSFMGLGESTMKHLLL